MVDSVQCAGWGHKNAADMEPDLKRVLNYQNYLKAISTIGTSNHTVIDYLTPQWAGSLEEISSLLDLVMEMEKCKFHIGDVRPFFGCTISIHQVRIVVESLWFSADLLRQASSSHNHDGATKEWTDISGMKFALISEFFGSCFWLWDECKLESV